MTKEEAIKLIRKYECNKEHYEACEMAIKALEQPSVTDFADKCKECGKRLNEKLQERWIPVSERLPEEPYGCIVTIEDEEPMTGQFFENILSYFVGWDGERWNDSDGEQCPFEVIAWMPLPEEPYKAESEG